MAGIYCLCVCARGVCDVKGAEAAQLLYASAPKLALAAMLLAGKKESNTELHSIVQTTHTCTRVCALYGGLVSFIHACLSALCINVFREREADLWRA